MTQQAPGLGAALLELLAGLPVGATLSLLLGVALALTGISLLSSARRDEIQAKKRRAASKKKPVARPPENPAEKGESRPPAYKTAYGRAFGGMDVFGANEQYLGDREEQQDECALSNLMDDRIVAKWGALCVLCDGIGGMKLGRQSAKAAADAFMESYPRFVGALAPSEALHQAAYEANARVFQMASSAGMAGKAGSTLAAAVVKDGKLYFAGCGDSRVYLCRDGNVRKLNIEHNFLRELERQVQLGNLTREEALNHPDRGRLTSFIGSGALPELDVSRIPIPVRPGDRILLLSDGVFKTLPDEQIASILSSGRITAHSELIWAVKAAQAPHQDNATAAVLYCEEAGRG